MSKAIGKTVEAASANLGLARVISRCSKVIPHQAFGAATGLLHRSATDEWNKGTGTLRHDFLKLSDNCHSAIAVIAAEWLGQVTDGFGQLHQADDGCVLGTDCCQAGLD